MPFIFSELSGLSSSSRIDLFASDPQSIEEILQYYLCPMCSPNSYGELLHVTAFITNQSIRDKMTALMLDASPVRYANHFAYSAVGNRQPLVVPTYKLKPPTDRLGGLYSQEKLDHVLSGIQAGTALPPVEVSAIAGGDFDYAVIDGIHRYYSSVKLGLARIPVLVR